MQSIKMPADTKKFIPSHTGYAGVKFFLKKEQVSEQGLEGLSEMIRALVNEAMRMERQNHLRARLYERTEDRRGYRIRKHW